MAALVCVLGNAVVVKPSEVSEHTSQLIADILPQYLDRVSAALHKLCCSSVSRGCPSTAAPGRGRAWWSPML